MPLPYMAHICPIHTPYILTCICIYIYIRKRSVYVHVYVNMYVYTFMYIHLLCIHMYTYAHILYTSIYVYIYRERDITHIKKREMYVGATVDSLDPQANLRQHHIMHCL